MEHYAGIDVSLELSSVCVVDAKGKIVRKPRSASDRRPWSRFFAGLDLAMTRIGLEAGPSVAMAACRTDRRPDSRRCCSRRGT